MTPSKQCTRCSTTKPLTAFPPNKGTRDGKQSWCHECYRLWQRYRRRADAGVRERDAWRTRTRHRALEELAERHAAEFDVILTRIRVMDDPRLTREAS